MKHAYYQDITEKLGLSSRQVENTIELLEAQNTIPFISRYRKERTGNLDEVQVAAVKHELETWQAFEKRRESILQSIEKQDKLTPQLKQQIAACKLLTELEDLYLPYKNKRKTRAAKAKENGLEPLAKLMLAHKNADSHARNYLTENVKSTEEALQGARDIVAEKINEDLRVRNSLRYLFDKEAVISSKLIKGKEEEAVKFTDYFDWEEPLKRCPSYRLLAMKRGEKLGFLRLKITADSEKSLENIERFYWRNKQSNRHLKQAGEDAYKRLLLPSLETEFFKKHKEKADEQAIAVFAENLRQLLLSSPLGEKRVLAIDPGFRTGCKTVCLDEQGNLLHNETIYPHPPQNQATKASLKLTNLIKSYKIDAIAIGNGTAGRETLQLVNKLFLAKTLEVFLVNEDGASVYSASALAREEFPDYDVTVRGAVSIGRRLLDPLSELVKIEPKSIGVGKYQHDVNPKLLKESLTQTVESCVNWVGVNLNTASRHLLTYVSGLNQKIAQNIVDYRSQNGAFKSRSELKKVARLGAKSFENSAGFLRIENGTNPLDNSAVHPESYPIVKKMAKHLGIPLSELMQSPDLQNNSKLKHFVGKEIGLLDFRQIISELRKPTRDPRQKAKAMVFNQKIKTIENLKVGMKLPGLVTNITSFGAFVDLGIKENGLIHVSEVCEERIKSPAEKLTINQKLIVKVIQIDFKRKRIQLSLKQV